MKEKQKNLQIKKFIADETGIQISEYLSTLICNPHRLVNANNADLEKIVKEFAPIYQRFRGTLDGSGELQEIMLFSLNLQCRIGNKSALLQLLTRNNPE